VTFMDVQHPKRGTGEKLSGKFKPLILDLHRDTSSNTSFQSEPG
jgi:hypothetical protein